MIAASRWALSWKGVVGVHAAIRSLTNNILLTHAHSFIPAQTVADISWQAPGAAVWVISYQTFSDSLSLCGPSPTSSQTLPQTPFQKCSMMFTLSRKTSALSFSPATQNIVPWTSSCASDNVGTERRAGDRFRGQDGDESGGTLHLTTDQIQVLRKSIAAGQGSPGTPQHRAC